MRLVSLNVGRPRLVEWRGRMVSTGIFKEPVAGRVMLRRLNLDGDRQADLTVHGGRNKAVYVYPSEHYQRWRAELSDPQLSYAHFGENFTTEGLDETTVNIGDEFRIGTARVVVTQPRQPCYKLGVRFGRADMVRRFHESRLSGFYLAVMEGAKWARAISLNSQSAMSKASASQTSMPSSPATRLRRTRSGARFRSRPCPKAGVGRFESC